MTKPFAALLCAACAAVLVGCRAKSVAPPAAVSPSARAKQAQDQKTQQFITKQRAKARQQSRTHRVH